MSDIQIKDIVKRDLNLDIWKKIYQIQAEKDDNFVIIKHVGTFSQTPVVSILELSIDIFQCSLVSFMIDENDIKKRINNSYPNYYPMIGFLIRESKNENVKMSLEFVFVLDYLKIGDNMEFENIQIDGKFEIRLYNDQSDYRVMETYSSYIGREESIYELVRILSDNIIEWTK